MSGQKRAPVLFLNCKSKIHPHFIASGIYLYKFMWKSHVEFTFTNIRNYVKYVKWNAALKSQLFYNT